MKINKKRRQDKYKKRKKKEEEEEEDLNQLIFKPSGPDGRFWGQFREFNEEEIEMFLEKKEILEHKNLELEIRNKQIKIGKKKAEKVNLLFIE